MTLLGFALPFSWTLAKTSAATNRRIDSGLLRPSMIVLPPTGSAASGAQGKPLSRRHAAGVLEPGEIAMSESEIEQGQFFRSRLTIPEGVAASDGARTHQCPSALLARYPVTCVRPVEAARYVIALTEHDNGLRRGGTPLTQCYKIVGDKVVWADRRCTGYRLPDFDEWARAARATKPGATKQAEGAGSLAPAMAAGEANAWYLYDMDANADELVMRPSGAAEIAWGVVTNGGQMRPWSGKNWRLGFRIVRGAEMTR